MEWNGRKYRPAGQVMKKANPDYQDMLKPYGQKNDNGNVWIPVLQMPGNVPQDAVPVSPTPTPSITPTNTPSNTPTSTPTPSVTATNTPTPTITNTQTPTNTGTATPTPTKTPTPTPSPIPISLTFVSNTLNTANQSSYTFSSVSTGVGLIVIVVNGTANYNSGRAFTNATIGGVTATAAHNDVANGGSVPANTSIQGLIYAVVTGATNNIVVNFNGTVNSASISCWRIENATSTTPFYSDGYTNVNNIVSMSRTTSSLSGRNVCVAGCMIGDGNLGDNTWTNATERYDTNIEAGGYPKITGADFATSASGAVTVTCNFPALNDKGAVFAMAVWK